MGSDYKIIAMLFRWFIGWDCDDRRLFWGKLLYSGVALPHKRRWVLRKRREESDEREEQ